MKDSKTRLLEVALKLFATKGLDGVSTREIAQKAQVNISAITYYFSGKESLYLAVLEYIKDILKKDAADIIKVLTYNKNLDDMSIKEAREIFLKAYSTIIDAAFTPKNIYMSMILAKESVNPSAMAMKVFTEKMFPLSLEMKKLISKITGLPKNSKKTVIITETLLNQAVLFGRDKERIFMILGLKKYDDKTKILIKEIVLNQVETLLNYYIKEKK